MAGKQGNGEGTIRKRLDGRWEARFVLDDGTRRSIYGKTRQEVAQLLTQMLRDRELGALANTPRQTLDQYLESWLAKEKHEVEPSSYIRYMRVVRTHLIGQLGHNSLARLTAHQVQAFYARKLDEGASASSVRYMHVVLHSALDDAVRLGILPRNVTDYVTIPRLRRQEIKPLSEEQARLLLEAAQGHRYEALYILGLATGMRRGELLALRWEDVQFGDASVQVNATLQVTPEGYKLAKPKTSKSRRRIALSPRVIDALRRHRAHQAAERLRLGEAWADLDMVFPNAAGEVYEPSNFVRRQFLPLLRKAGLPRIRFHDLRHTAATLLLGQGVNVKVVSEMLGHSNISITLNIYGHVLPHMQQHAVETMDRLLWGSSNGLGSIQGSNS